MSIVIIMSIINIIVINIMNMIITFVIIIVVTVKPQFLTRALVLGEPRWQGDLRFQNNDLYDL
jgi:hypothetical protein